MKIDSQFNLAKKYFIQIYLAYLNVKKSKILGEEEGPLWINSDQFSWEFKGVMILIWKITFFVIDPYEISNVAGTPCEEVRFDLKHVLGKIECKSNFI